MAVAEKKGGIGIDVQRNWLRVCVRGVLEGIEPIRIWACTEWSREPL